MLVRIEKSWKELLHNEFEKPYFEKLSNFVKTEFSQYPNAIFPKGGQIFRALDLCPVENVKVVILGQDPYPTRGHAHGLCFSCDSNVKPLPKSLKNIYKEIEQDLGIIKGSDGDLQDWAKQGVLLLNTVLTVKEGLPDSHANKGWENFTDAILKGLNAERENVVYILWGSKAQKKSELLNHNNNLILKSPHPSPLSAYRGFFGCKHFSATNDYLKSHGKSPINW
jgi:uracil-DNA glycosylase